MRNGGVAPLRQNRLVVFHHAQAGDLAGHDLFEMAEGQDFAAEKDVIALDDALPQDAPDAINDSFRARTDRGDHLDFPGFLPLACELREIFAAAPIDAPSPLLHRCGDAVIEVERDVTQEGDGLRRPEVSKDSVEKEGVTLDG